MSGALKLLNTAIPGQVRPGAVVARHLDFWKRALAGTPENINLPSDFGPDKDSVAKAGRRRLLLNTTLVSAMTEFAQRERTTPFMLLMSSLAVTLHKWTGQNDLTIGTVVAGRTRREMESMLGCFMNFLPIRTRVTETQSSKECSIMLCCK